jgi:hypothetical protein
MQWAKGGNDWQMKRYNEPMKRCDEHLKGGHELVKEFEKRTKDCDE